MDYGKCDPVPDMCTREAIIVKSLSEFPADLEDTAYIWIEFSLLVSRLFLYINVCALSRMTLIERIRGTNVTAVSEPARL